MRVKKTFGARRIDNKIICSMHRKGRFVGSLDNCLIWFLNSGKPKVIFTVLAGETA